jgi:hypothetical protein
MPTTIRTPAERTEKWLHRLTLAGATDTDRKLITAIQAEESPDALLETLRRTGAEIESSDADPGVRFDRQKRVDYFVCYRLAELGTDDAFAALAGLLTSDRASLRDSACHRIATCPAETAVPLLLDALDHFDPKVRAGAAEGLWRHGHSEAIPRMVAMLRTPAWEERRRVAWVLAYFGDPSVKPALRRARWHEWRRPWRLVLWPRRVRAYKHPGFEPSAE